MSTGGIVIATADNKLAALDHYIERGNLDALEAFVKTGCTRWLTADEEEQFDLTTFTPVFRRLRSLLTDHQKILVGKT